MQGKLLPMPETVPFRLTADMVDGLGITGPEGVFRRCAEETLRVLQDGSEVIRLVLEVFKHDPLHSWCAARSRAASHDIDHRQDCESCQNSTRADRRGRGDRDADERIRTVWHRH